jgi:hypothetical protein
MDPYDLDGVHVWCDLSFWHGPRGKQAPYNWANRKLNDYLTKPP